MTGRIDLIQMRRGTTAQWTAANPVLASGELGYDSDLNTLKSGNGTAAYSARSAIGAGQPIDATLTALAALTIAAESLTIGTGADAFSQVTFAANTFPARASTGSLVAKTISDAALSVLDDATLDAMLATLGGAAVQGTGGLVRATSPTLVSPALGTPSALVGTNITGTAAGLTAGIASAVAVGGITGLGANIATALAIAVGSAGAPVTLNGALGTPSSGTLTSCTGLPAAGVVGTAAVLGANTFTRRQTITQGTANEGILASTGYSLTGADATSMVDLAGVWNTTGNPVAIKLAITNTASGATAKFLSLLAGAAGTTEVFYLDKSGDVSLRRGMVTELLTLAGPNGLKLDSFGAAIALASNYAIEWSSTTNYDSTHDIFLRRIAAGTLGIINGVNAQAIQVYGTASGSPGTDYARAALLCSTTEVTLTAQVGGAGGPNIPINLTPAGNGRVVVSSWITDSGHKFKTADQTNASATLASDTHLTVTVVAGRKYSFIAYLNVTTGAVLEGVKVALTGTATITNLIADVEIKSHAGTPVFTLGRITAFDTAIGQTIADAGGATVEIAGTFEANAAGTFLVSWAKNASTGATNTTAKRGSYLKIWDCP